MPYDCSHEMPPEELMEKTEARFTAVAEIQGNPRWGICQLCGALVELPREEEVPDSDWSLGLRKDCGRI